jgi:hypothetical protein
MGSLSCPWNSHQRQPMDQPGLDNRHRDKNGRIARKHGNTRIGTLRKHYGAHFARGCSDEELLVDVLHKLDEPSLSHLIRDEEAGKLEKVCQG